MNKEELKEMLKENLAISIDKDGSDGSIVTVKLFFDEELIDESYYFG